MSLPIRTAAALLAALPLPAAAATPIFCSIDERPATPCTMTDRVEGGGHVMTFQAGGTRVTFTGRGQTGWWAGKLNGKPAMGYELNRGHTRISTYDLQTSFAWWYAGQEHGTY